MTFVVSSLQQGHQRGRVSVFGFLIVGLCVECEANVWSVLAVSWPAFLALHPQVLAFPRAMGVAPLFHSVAGGDDSGTSRPQTQ